MRYLLGSIIFIFFAVSCKQNGKAGDKEEPKVLSDTIYTIIGYFDTIPDGTKVVLTYLGIDTIPDTSMVKGGKFEFKGKMQEPLMAELYTLDRTNNPGPALRFVAENAVINIEGKKGPIKDATVIGGLQNSDYGSMKKVLNLYWDSLNALNSKAQQAEVLKDSVQMRNIEGQLDTMKLETKNALKQFVVEHPTSIAGAFYVYRDLRHSLNLRELDSIYNSFDTSIHNSIYVKKIKQAIDAARRTDIGQQAPELNVNNARLDTVTLASYNGKYLLLSFWASFSEPSRKDNTQLVKLYKQFKRKDFDILGVSIDEDRKAWLQAIRKDQLTWNHVSDLKGWKSSVVPLYGIESIPAYILLDRDGKIIAKNISPEKLHEKLNEVIRAKSSAKP